MEKHILFHYILIFLILLSIIINLFSVEIIAEETNKLKLDFPISIGFALPLFTNLSADILSTFIFNFDNSILFKFHNSAFYFGFYYQFTGCLRLFLDTLNTLFWIVAFPITLPLWFAGIISFPEFHETDFDINGGILTAINIIKKSNLEIDLSLRFGFAYGVYNEILFDYLENSGYVFLPQILIKFPFSKGGIGLDTSYKIIFIFNHGSIKDIIYFPILGIYIFFLDFDNNFSINIYKTFKEIK